jgi:hypothetical protein
MQPPPVGHLDLGAPLLNNIHRYRNMLQTPNRLEAQNPPLRDGKQVVLMRDEMKLGELVSLHLLL